MINRLLCLRNCNQGYYNREIMPMHLEIQMTGGSSTLCASPSIVRPYPPIVVKWYVTVLPELGTASAFSNTLSP